MDRLAYHNSVLGALYRPISRFNGLHQEFFDLSGQHLQVTAGMDILPPIGPVETVLMTIPRILLPTHLGWSQMSGLHTN